jgi:outer membrane biosynthesis protein TonB
MRGCIALAMVIAAIGCEADTKREAAAPRDRADRAAEPEKLPAPAQPTRVAQGDPCEGGEATPTSGGSVAGGPPDMPTDPFAMEEDAIFRTLRAHANQLRACYTKQLAKQPGLAGKLVVRFVVGTDGKVTSASAAVKLQDDVDACVLAGISKLEFDRPSTSHTITYPLKFNPP